MNFTKVLYGSDAGASICVGRLFNVRVGQFTDGKWRISVGSVSSKPLSSEEEALRLAPAFVKMLLRKELETIS